MLVTALVVEQGAVLHDLFDQRHGDMGMRRPGGLLTLRGSARGSLSGKFQHIESNTRIAIGKNRYLLQRILIDGDVHLTQAALLVRERPPQNGQNMLFFQSSQHEDARTGQQGRVDFKARILRGSANQCHYAALDMREHSILLRFVEAVNLVDKEDGLLFAELAQLLCLLNYPAQVRDAG